MFVVRMLDSGVVNAFIKSKCLSGVILGSKCEIKDCIGLTSRQNAEALSWHNHQSVTHQ